MSATSRKNKGARMSAIKHPIIGVAKRIEADNRWLAFKGNGRAFILHGKLVLVREFRPDLFFRSGPERKYKFA